MYVNTTFVRRVQNYYLFLELQDKGEFKFFTVEKAYILVEL